MHLQPGDVVWIAIGEDIVKPRKRQWTYNLLNDITHTDLSGSALYPKPELDAVMGLYMLARFKRITFEIDFGWEITALDAYPIHWHAGRKSQGFSPTSQAFLRPASGWDKQLLLPSKIALDENVLDQVAPDLFINTIRTVHQLIEILSKPSDISHFDHDLMLGPSRITNMTST